MPYKNKEDNARQSREYYRKNPSQKKIINKKNRAQAKWLREFVKRYKRFASCVDCGEGNPLVLDFDHVRGKKFAAISRMAQCSYSLERLKEEMRKCEVRCSNCHRIKTHERRNS